MRSRTRQNIHVCLYSLAGIKSYLSDLCHNITIARMVEIIDGCSYLWCVLSLLVTFVYFQLGKVCFFICVALLINNYWMGFCDIQNNQGWGKCYQPKPKAEAGNTNRDFCDNTNWGFCDIQNNQGWGMCYQPQPSASRPWLFWISQKPNLIIVLISYIVLKKIMTNAYRTEHSLFSASHVLIWTWHCSWKSCIAHATYRSVGCAVSQN